MTDIAQLGFRVDSAELSGATKELNALKAAAAGVTVEQNKMARAAEGSAVAQAKAATAAARYNRDKAAADVASIRAMDKVNREELKAALAIQRTASAELKATKASESRVNVLNKEAAAQREVAKEAKLAAAQLASMRPGTSVGGIVNNGRVNGAPISRDAMPNKFNTANIAAQFQDIGVTASMGMNPMIIALQQGTQLSAIMQSMESPLKGIGVALKSVFNAVSLGTIAFVAIIAALIQMVNWTKTAKIVLNALADAVEVATPYVLGFAAALALIYSRSILTGLWAIGSAFVAVGTSAFAAGGQMALAWIIGMGPVGWVIAGIVAVGAAFQAMGFNVVGYMKDAMNAVVGSIAFALNKISELINNSIDKMQEYRKYLSFIPGIGSMLGLGADAVGSKRMGNVVEPGKEFKTDYVGQAVDGATALGKSAANSLRNLAKGIGTGDKDGKQKKDPWVELQKGAERTIATLQAEQDALGMTEEATAKLKYETDLLNEAQQKNIKLTPDMRDKIAGLATTMAAITEKTRGMTDALDFARDAGKGFISDLRSGLAEGKSLWESFGNAVANVLNKIVDKLLDASINGLFGGSGLGGLSKGITGLLGAFGMGGTESAIASSIAANPGIYAKGGAFNGGIQKFAAGGVFGNPTLFNMAGGKTGVMGEKGPEAIMPLHRGPDGSLGVKVNGGTAANDNQQSGGNTYVINAPGASKADLESVKQTMFALLGTGRIEARIANAQARGMVT